MDALRHTQPARTALPLPAPRRPSRALVPAALDPHAPAHELFALLGHLLQLRHRWHMGAAPLRAVSVLPSRPAAVHVLSGVSVFRRGPQLCTVSAARVPRSAFLSRTSAAA